MKISEIYENIIVMVYILILVITTTIIILYSKNIYAKMGSYNDSFEELEVAMSYINVKLRQNDKVGDVKVEPVVETENNALTIEREHDKIWITQHENELVKVAMEKGKQPDFENYIKIANIRDFEVKKKGRVISYYVKVDDEFEDTNSIYLRSDN